MDLAQLFTFIKLTPEWLLTKNNMLLYTFFLQTIISDGSSPKPGSEGTVTCFEGSIISQDLKEYLKSLHFAMDIDKNVQPVQTKPGSCL